MGDWLGSDYVFVSFFVHSRATIENFTFFGTIHIFISSFQIVAKWSSSVRSTSLAIQSTRTCLLKFWSNLLVQWINFPRVKFLTFNWKQRLFQLGLVLKSSKSANAVDLEWLIKMLLGCSFVNVFPSSVLVSAWCPILTVGTVGVLIWSNIFLQAGKDFFLYR